MRSSVQKVLNRSRCRTFGLWARMGLKNHVLDGPKCSHGKRQLWAIGAPVVKYKDFILGRYTEKNERISDILKYRYRCRYLQYRQIPNTDEKNTVSRFGISGMGSTLSSGILCSQIHGKSQIPLHYRYPANEPAREMVRDLLASWSMTCWRTDSVWHLACHALSSSLADR